jgi:hypothetical protein
LYIAEPAALGEKVQQGPLKTHCNAARWSHARNLFILKLAQLSHAPPPIPSTAAEAGRGRVMYADPPRRCIMRFHLLLAAAASLTLAACADSSTAPPRIVPPDKPAADITCRSGYHIATRFEGGQTCVPDDGGTAAATPAP